MKQSKLFFCSEDSVNKKINSSNTIHETDEDITVLSSDEKENNGFASLAAGSPNTKNANNQNCGLDLGDVFEVVLSDDGKTDPPSLDAITTIDCQSNTTNTSKEPTSSVDSIVLKNNCNRLNTVAVSPKPSSSNDCNNEKTPLSTLLTDFFLKTPPSISPTLSKMSPCSNVSIDNSSTINSSERHLSKDACLSPTSSKANVPTTTPKSSKKLSREEKLAKMEARKIERERILQERKIAKEKREQEKELQKLAKLEEKKRKEADREAQKQEMLRKQEEEKHRREIEKRRKEEERLEKEKAKEAERLEKERLKEAEKARKEEEKKKFLDEKRKVEEEKKKKDEKIRNRFAGYFIHKNDVCSAVTSGEKNLTISTEKTCYKEKETPDIARDCDQTTSNNDNDEKTVLFMPFEPTKNMKLAPICRLSSIDKLNAIQNLDKVLLQDSVAHEDIGQKYFDEIKEKMKRRTSSATWPLCENEDISHTEFQPEDEIMSDSESSMNDILVINENMKARAEKAASATVSAQESSTAEDAMKEKMASYDEPIKRDKHKYHNDDDDEFLASVTIEGMDDSDSNGSSNNINKENKFSLKLAMPGKHKAKLFQFDAYEWELRPAYYGTFRKERSRKINPKNPFKRDEDLLDYGEDSGEEWEDPSDGEDITNAKSDEEDEGVGGDDDEDDGFFVPHGYLSDDEGCSDNEEVPPEVIKAVQQQKAKLWEEHQRDGKIEGTGKNGKNGFQSKHHRPLCIGCCWYETLFETGKRMADDDEGAENVAKVPDARFCFSGNYDGSTHKKSGKMTSSEMLETLQKYQMRLIPEHPIFTVPRKLVDPKTQSTASNVPQSDDITMPSVNSAFEIKTETTTNVVKKIPHVNLSDVIFPINLTKRIRLNEGDTDSDNEMSDSDGKEKPRKKRKKRPKNDNDGNSLKNKKKPVPEEAMPDLIRFMHGCTESIKTVAKKFRLAWQVKVENDEKQMITVKKGDDTNGRIDNDTESKENDSGEYAAKIPGKLSDSTKNNTDNCEYSVAKETTDDNRITENRIVSSVAEENDLFAKKVDFVISKTQLFVKIREIAEYVLCTPNNCDVISRSCWLVRKPFLEKYGLSDLELPDEVKPRRLLNSDESSPISQKPDSEKMLKNCSAKTSNDVNVPNDGNPSPKSPASKFLKKFTCKMTPEEALAQKPKTSLAATSKNITLPSIFSANEQQSVVSKEDITKKKPSCLKNAYITFKGVKVPHHRMGDFQNFIMNSITMKKVEGSENDPDEQTDVIMITVKQVLNEILDKIEVELANGLKEKLDVNEMHNDENENNFDAFSSHDRDEVSGEKLRKIPKLDL